VADNREEVLGAVRETRAALRERRIQPFVAAMARARGYDPLEIPVETVREGPAGWERTGDTITAVVEAYYPTVSPERAVELPEAYLVPAEAAAVIELLHMHRVEVLPLASGRELEVERYILGDREEVDLVETTVRFPAWRSGGSATGPGKATCTYRWGSCGECWWRPPWSRSPCTGCTGTQPSPICSRAGIDTRYSAFRRRTERAVLPPPRPTRRSGG
jgi:hypothetical protein